MKLLVVFFTCIISQSLAQTAELPYREIPAYPKQYTASSVAVRMVDALGFRYYWATEGLRAEDISFSPNADARTAQETLTHIFDLTQILLNSVNEIANDNSLAIPEMTFEEIRRQTLENIKATSEKLSKSRDKDLAKFNMIFKRSTSKREFPFWNALNGPLADALWHTGQVVSLRRSSGNPLNPKANVLTGKLDN